MWKSIYCNNTNFFSLNVFGKKSTVEKSRLLNMVYCTVFVYCIAPSVEQKRFSNGPHCTSMFKLLP